MTTTWRNKDDIFWWFKWVLRFFLLPCPYDCIHNVLVVVWCFHWCTEVSEHEDRARSTVKSGGDPLESRHHFQKRCFTCDARVPFGEVSGWMCVCVTVALGSTGVFWDCACTTEVVWNDFLSPILLSLHFVKDSVPAIGVVTWTRLCQIDSFDFEAKKYSSKQGTWPKKVQIKLIESEQNLQREGTWNWSNWMVPGFLLLNSQGTLILPFPTLVKVVNLFASFLPINSLCALIHYVGFYCLQQKNLT